MQLLCLDYLREFPDELTVVADLMVEKELRMRAPLEEVELFVSSKAHPATGLESAEGEQDGADSTPVELELLETSKAQSASGLESVDREQDGTGYDLVGVELFQMHKARSAAGLELKEHEHDGTGSTLENVNLIETSNANSASGLETMKLNIEGREMGEAETELNDFQRIHQNTASGLPALESNQEETVSASVNMKESTEVCESQC